MNQPSASGPPVPSGPVAGEQVRAAERDPADVGREVGGALDVLRIVDHVADRVAGAHLGPDLRRGALGRDAELGHTAFGDRAELRDAAFGGGPDVGGDPARGGPHVGRSRCRTGGPPPRARTTRRTADAGRLGPVRARPGRSSRLRGLFGLHDVVRRDVRRDVGRVGLLRDRRPGRRQRPPVAVDEPQLDPRQGTSHGARFRDPVERGARHHRSGLRQAVALDDAVPGRLVEGRRPRPRQRHAAARAQPQPGQRGPQPLRRELEQRPVRRGHAGQRAHPVPPTASARSSPSGRPGAGSTAVAPAQQTWNRPAASP